jgi:hypothetical protein
MSYETSNCRVCYSNLLENGTVSASSENASYPVANAYDWVTGDYFRPAATGTIYITLSLVSPASADYFAFYDQDVWRYSGSLKLQYWDGAAWADASATVSPTDNSPQVVFFTPQTSTQWRVAITCGTIFNLGSVSFGEYQGLPLGMYLNWTPPVLARNNTAINSVSELGSFLGRSLLARGVRTSLNLQGAPDAWVRSDWLPFIKHAEVKPFWFVPNVSGYPIDVMYCWVEDNLSPPVHNVYGYMSQSLQLVGVIE